MSIDAYLSELRRALPKSMRKGAALADEIEDHLLCAMEDAGSEGAAGEAAVAEVIARLGEPEAFLRRYRRAMRSPRRELAFLGWQLLRSLLLAVACVGAGLALYGASALVLTGLAHRRTGSCSPDGRCVADYSPAVEGLLIGIPLLVLAGVAVMLAGRWALRLGVSRPRVGVTVKVLILGAVAVGAYWKDFTLQSGLGVPFTLLVCACCVGLIVTPAAARMFRRHRPSSA